MNKLTKAKIKIMQKHNFMPHNDGFPCLSRDWEDIDCKAILCRYNISLKCSVPSIAVIGEDGKCTGFKLITTRIE